MAETRFITAADGARIAYDVSGRGPALMLLHGFGNSRLIWHGWVEHLDGDFSVIAVDLRGCGESEAPLDPARYSPAAHLADLHQIADACGAARFGLIGFSWGATVARYLAAHSERVTRAVLIGTYFGQYFTGAYLARLLENYSGNPLQTARVQGLRAWPGIEAAELRCPTLVITGSEDGNVVKMLRLQREVVEAAGIGLEIFEGLDHGGLIETVDTVLPRVRAFVEASG
jgi:pimeloyl-ACP methyl ester carboxylesterase